MQFEKEINLPTIDLEGPAVCCREGNYYLVVEPRI